MAAVRAAAGAAAPCASAADDADGRATSSRSRWPTTAPDLADVARLTGLSERRGRRGAHRRRPGGSPSAASRPGFGYLVGEDDRLHVPRRDESRTAVPAGAVGLAGEFSGVYPRESPGGWQLIGTHRRGDVGPRPRPAGAAARRARGCAFVEVGGRERGRCASARTGPLALVEDLGRPGRSGIGVGRSGAADRAALRQANRALGNPEGAAARRGHPRRARGRGRRRAPCGSASPARPCPVSVDGRERRLLRRARRARPGSVLRLGVPAHGPAVLPRGARRPRRAGRCSARAATT